MLAACDSGYVEMYRVHGPVLCETESRVQAHDDMVLGVALLAGGEKAVTVGQDRKSVWCAVLHYVDCRARPYSHIYTMDIHACICKTLCLS